MTLFKTFTVAAAGMLLAASALAQPGHEGHSHGQGGERFTKLATPQPTAGGDKVEVIEFFWYGCPHCHQLEPAIETWLKTAPKDVQFKRVPAVPSENWARLAAMFYTLEAMGVLDRFHPKVFDAIHKDKLRLEQNKVRDEWLARQGIDVAKYQEVEKSFSVVSKVQRARQLTRDYRVGSVPMIAVDGRYVTSAEQAGGAAGVFAVVDELVAIARKK